LVELLTAVIVKNSTNINKEKQSPLNSDGQQFHQYQQNQQPPLNMMELLTITA
jgi:hypothetical protein